MLTITVVGASHGKRLCQALRRHQDYGKQFVVNDLSQPGKPYFDLAWPKLETLSENDLLIVIPLGNDLVERKYVYRENSTGIIHLKSFVPRADSYFETRFEDLAEKLSKANCKIRLINNVYRHNCCPVHRHPGWLSYQNKINRQIEQRFNSAKICVIDHRKFIPLSFREAKNVSNYRSFQKDSVHFKNYSYMADFILKSIQ
jgi:lysophospholipase L1-like esterase